MRQFVTIREELANLPKLFVGKSSAVSGHAGEPDPVRNDPVVLTHRIVAHVVFLEKLRWLGEHPAGQGGFRLVVDAVAVDAVLAVDVGSG